MACYCRCSVLLRIALVGFFASDWAGESDAGLVGKTQIVAYNGTLDPAVPRIGWLLPQPYLNDRGELLFSGVPYQADGTYGTALKLYRNKGEVLSEVAVEGIQTSDGSRKIADYLLSPEPLNWNRSLGTASNRNGIISFSARSVPTDNSGQSSIGIYRLDSELVELNRIGLPSPDGIGTFSEFSHYVFNDRGQVAYYGQITDSGGSSPSSSGIFLSGSDGTKEIVREGWSAPDGDGTFSSFNSSYFASTDGYIWGPTRRFRVALNNEGQVAFLHHLQGTQNGWGVFLGDGDSIVQIVREDDLVVPVIQIFNTVGRHFQLQLNDAGQVAFGGSNGILRANDSSLDFVAYYGKEIANDIGLLGRNIYFQMNKSGTVAFCSWFANNSNYSKGLFVADGNGDVRLLVSSGHVLPDGDGELYFSHIQTFAFNDAGQIAFVAEVRNSSPWASQGLFLYDPVEGLTQIARTGQEYLGRVIQRLTIETGDADNLKGFNNRGQIAYRFELNDQTEGIALWTPVPEPSTIVLLSIALLAIAVAGRIEFRSKALLSLRPIAANCGEFAGRA